MRNLNPVRTAENVEALRKNISSLKAHVAALLTESVRDGAYYPAEELAKHANRIAELEGALEVAHLLHHAEENEASSEALARMLLQEAVRPNDDTWSGRANDVRRAFADGRRSAIQEALYKIEL